MNISSIFIQAYISILLNSAPSPHTLPAQLQALQQALQQAQAAREADIPYEEQGLVNILGYIPDALIDIRYSDTLNFLHTDVYGNYCSCHTQELTASRLHRADSLLKRANPSLRFVFYDCTRPVSVQQRMWVSLKHIPLHERGRYVSNPRNHSVHNYGAAVDIALADTAGNILDMGTGFDHFGPEAYPYMENSLLQKGILSEAQVANRRLLRRVMLGAGFRQQPYEWWHYNVMPRSSAKARYKVMYGY